MDSDHSITNLIACAKDGDELAMRDLWDRYFHRLVGLARTRLRGAPRRVEDEEDVAIHAMQSFFDGARKDRFASVHDRDDLWRLLVKMTVYKASKQRQAARARKRGGGQVRGESVFMSPDANDDMGGIDEAIARELTPEVAEDFFHRCDELLAELPDPTLKLIARRKLEGHGNADIAAELGCVERTVDRKLARIRAIWKHHRG